MPDRWKVTKCLECGEIARTAATDHWPTTCKGGGRHGPTQEIEVQSTEIAAELIGHGEEILDAAQAMLERDDEPRFKRALAAWDACVDRIVGKNDG